MHVDVEHGLPSIGTVVEHNPEGITNTLLFGNLTGLLHHPTDDVLIVIVDVAWSHDMFFGDDQKMDRSPGGNIAEGKDVVILVQLVSRDITVNYFTEETIVVHGFLFMRRGEVSFNQQGKCTLLGGGMQFIALWPPLSEEEPHERDR